MVLAHNPNLQDIDDAGLSAMPPCNIPSTGPAMES